MQISTFWKDAAERIGWSVAYAIAATFVATSVYDLDAAKAAGVAGLTAALTVVKVLAAKQIGDKNSAAIG